MEGNKAMSDKIYIFDTTLRDGEQSAGVSFSLKEKIKIAKQLERLGVDIIEAPRIPAAPDPLGFVFLRPALAHVKDQLGDVDLHGADIDTALAHGAIPYPLGRLEFIVHSQCGHAQEFPGVHAAEAGGRAPGRTGAAGETKVEVTPIRQEGHDLVFEYAFPDFSQSDFIRLHTILLNWPLLWQAPPCWDQGL